MRESQTRSCCQKPMLTYVTRDGEYVSLGYFEKFDAEAVLNELRAAKL